MTSPNPHLSTFIPTSRWVRNKSGTVVHHADCPVARPSHNWTWPDDFGYETDDELLMGIESAGADWLKPCKVCFGLKRTPFTRLVVLVGLVEPIA